MRKISIEEWDSIPDDYKSVWTTERYDLAGWDNDRHRYMGKKTILREGGLEIEGISFEIVANEYEALPAEFMEFAVRSIFLLDPWTKAPFMGAVFGSSPFAQEKRLFLKIALNEDAPDPDKFKFEMLLHPFDCLDYKGIRRTMIGLAKKALISAQGVVAKAEMRSFAEGLAKATAVHPGEAQFTTDSVNFEGLISNFKVRKDKTEVVYVEASSDRGTSGFGPFNIDQDEVKIIPLSIMEHGVDGYEIYVNVVSKEKNLTSDRVLNLLNRQYRPACRGSEFVRNIWSSEVREGWFTAIVSIGLDV